MEAIDWGKIKTEYVTGLSSYRELAEKYGVDQHTVSVHGRREGWVEARQQYVSKRSAKTEEKKSNRQAERMAMLQGGAELMLSKILQALDMAEPEMLLADSKLSRSLTGALRDLKDVMDCKSSLDIEEQKARIEKLRMREDDSSQETVMRLEGVDDYGS